MLKTSFAATNAFPAPGVTTPNSRKIKKPELRRVASKIGYFSALNILRNFEGDERAKLERIAKKVTYRRGKQVYVPGVTGEVSFILVQGQVRVYHPAHDGSKLVITLLGPNSFFGEMSLLGQSMYGARAEALDDSLLWILTRAAVERLLVTHPKVGLHLLGLVSHRLMEVETQLDEVMFMNIRARIALLLLRHLSPEGFVVRGFSHQEIADRLGVYRETVTHALNELKRMGLIQIGRKRLTVLDAEGLGQLAQQ